MENQTVEKWTAEQVAVFMRMYPDDQQNRLSIASRLAEEFPAILADIGEEKARTVELWLISQGLRVQEQRQETRRESWVEVVRLLWLLLRRVKWQEVNPKEVLRVVVWRMMKVKA